MHKVLKAILIIVLFIGFFEAGLLSSYTIVTSQVPDVKGLIDLQIDTINGIFSSDNLNNVVIQDPTPLNVSNKEDLATKLQNETGVDGIDYDNLSIGTYDSKDNDQIKLNITAYGYSSSSSSSSSSIVISAKPDYKILATATANMTSEGEFKVNIDSVKINSILKIYNSASENTSTNTTNDTDTNTSQ
ncbi:MAG: hypothetical protein ACI4RQ_05330 [Methanobrevibacter wolinii]|uniref:hypothetical protein n=1 Tax=Methanobrevibacter wolinii TaxID=190977 RepID=UPI0005B2C8C1|nr:hypothetical protein [Methanobrevibacter wolinii]MDD5960337.1 hypothetical protein [Methanobrevibacter wolinii]